MSVAVENKPMQMIVLGEKLALTPDDIAEVILGDSDKHVEAKASEIKLKGLASFDNPDVRFEFQLSCDALNFVRVRLRYSVENGGRATLKPSPAAVSARLSARSGAMIPTTSIPRCRPWLRG